MRNTKKQSKLAEILLAGILSITPGCDMGDITGANDTPENTPPLIETEPITTAYVNQLYLYDLNAYDPEGETLIYFLIQAPSGMTIVEDTGLILWTPKAEDAGKNYEVEIGVSDGDKTSTQLYSIFVE